MFDKETYKKILDYLREKKMTFCFYEGIFVSYEHCYNALGIKYQQQNKKDCMQCEKTFIGTNEYCDECTVVSIGHGGWPITKRDMKEKQIQKNTHNAFYS